MAAYTLKATRDSQHRILQCKVFEWHRTRLTTVWFMIKSGLCEGTADCLPESRATEPNGSPKNSRWFRHGPISSS